MNVSSASGVLVSKGVGVGVTSHVSHVPRGLAAGASLAVRPVTPASNTQATGTLFYYYYKYFISVNYEAFFYISNKSGYFHFFITLFSKIKSVTEYLINKFINN